MLNSDDQPAVALPKNVLSTNSKGLGVTGYAIASNTGSTWNTPSAWSQTMPVTSFKLNLEGMTLCDPRFGMNIIQYCPTCRNYGRSRFLGESTQTRAEPVYDSYTFASFTEPDPFGPRYRTVEHPVEEYRCESGHVFHVPIQPAPAPRPAPAT